MAIAIIPRLVRGRVSLPLVDVFIPTILPIESGAGGWL